jgi:hypothetical protein
MSPIVIVTPDTGIRELHVLDGLDLTDEDTFQIADTPVFTPAPYRLDMVGGPDSDGTIPVDEGHSDNSTLLLPLRVIKQDTADLAWGAVTQVVEKLEACRRSPTGLAHLWTPKDSADTWEMTVRSGQVTEFPMGDRDAAMGYLRRSPLITILLTCDPFLYRDGELITYSEVTSSEPVFSILLEDVPGHVSAESTVTVTDMATQARRHVEGGLGANTDALLVDSAAGGLETTGFAGSLTTRTGMYGANVIRATLAVQSQAICGTGDLEHIGVLRPKARVWASSTDVRLRLAYRTGDGAYSYTPWIAPPVVDAFYEAPFGSITIREVTAGAQQWDGWIEAYSLVPGDTLDVDYLMPLDAERYWTIAANYRLQSGLLVARDEFTSTSGGLNGETAPTGGTWATSGATTDFAAVPGGTD